MESYQYWASRFGSFCVQFCHLLNHKYCLEDRQAFWQCFYYAYFSGTLLEQKTYSAFREYLSLKMVILHSFEFLQRIWLDGWILLQFGGEKSVLASVVSVRFLIMGLQFSTCSLIDQNHLKPYSPLTYTIMSVLNIHRNCYHWITVLNLRLLLFSVEVFALC